MFDRVARGARDIDDKRGGTEMKKTDIITKINSLITEHMLEHFDAVPQDTDMKVAELRDLLTDVEVAVAEATAPPVVRLADVCKELGKDPKTVRARMRRLYADEDAADLPQPIADAGQRWTFAEEAREAVVALVLNED